MNSLLLISLLIAIIGCYASPIIVRHRRSGPDGDFADPIGSARLRPVFLGQSTGLKKLRPGFTGRNIGHRTSVDPEDSGPEGAQEGSLSSFGGFTETEGLGQRADLSHITSQSFGSDSESDSEEVSDQHFGLPQRGIQEKIERQRRLREKIKNQHLMHPDSDALRGKSNRFVADDPLPEMIAVGDREANPFVGETSLSSLFSQFLMDSVGLK